MKRKVFFVCDEAAQCGYLESLFNAYGMARGFGVNLVTVWTDIEAMARIYTKYQSFLANSTVIMFPTNDPVSSEYAGKRCGTTEVVSRSKGVSEDREGRLRVSISIGAATRPVMHSYEVETMPRNEALIFTASLPALRVKVKRYFEDRFFRGKYGPNPYRPGRSED